MGLLGMLCYLWGTHAVRGRRGLGGINEDWRFTDNEERIHQALTADLGRHRLENDLYVFSSHIALVVMETP